ncbi:MAG: DUF4843 domain-containing protein [Chitinophagales bacterium]|nr:DUF4843 domain-containing protein [Chitinophagales bacterium]MCZ2392475.1 DUF4843 domain-containing protein [Chitinophagales bacterium]
MKKIFNATLLLLFATLTVVSCKKESLTYDGPTLGHFLKSSDVFYVDPEDSTYTVEIGLTKATDKDVTLRFEVDATSTAVDGEDYALGVHEVTIPAGQVIGKFDVVGLFTTLGEAVNLKLKLVEGDQTATFSNELDLTIRQFCPFVRDEFVGVYNVWSELNEDESGNIVEYEVEAIADPDNENGIIFLGLFVDGFDLKVSFDASNKANFQSIITAQTIFDYRPGYPAIIQAGKGTFNACNPEVQFTLEVKVPGMGSFGDVKTVLTKVD